VGVCQESLIQTESPKRKFDYGKLVFAIFILVFVFVITQTFPPSNKTDVLDDKYWQPQEQCAEWLPVYEIEEDTYNCRLEPCERLKTDSGTLVDKCTCVANNKTVYRYCSTMLIFHRYIGVTNASNLLSIIN